MDYTGLEYDDVRKWIRKKREKASNPSSWEEIFLACKNDEDSLAAFLESRHEDDEWPIMSIDDWKAIVQLQKDAEEKTIQFAIDTGAAIIHGDNQINSVNVSTNKSSSWQSYKNWLLSPTKGFKQETVNEIERATLSILRRLSLDTTNSNPRKGLVIGNVQSGKTANMAALMAMAADSGWNMFIVLSGTIESLRKQTEDRLFDDLHRDNCSIDWMPLNKPSSRSPRILKANAMRFNDRNHSYFVVSLKNKSRLKELMLWLQEDSNVQSQMKIMVIDDEADQAGVNTADVDSGERKAINDLITNLVNGKTWDGNRCRGHFKAMNYIGYTATPYANILNESGEESLYPRDFIATLSVSKEYFGPQQIFGCEDTGYEGIDIVRTIPKEDASDFDKLHKDPFVDLPQSALDAICWFLCGVACMRYCEYKKPISMLVHTSQKTDYHANVASAIENWINSLSTEEFIRKCRKVWESETKIITRADFLNQYPDYGISADKIRDYPAFAEIEKELRVLLDNSTPENPRISNIPMSDRRTPRYHNGIHLCVDNCKNNGIANDMMLRLMYPDQENMPSPAPAFIVVGGATLSRGLTIEGLISTYFLRSIKQSDTLMQMGRWFGYRKKYELIPRVWLTEDAIKQFEFLSLLDQRLRDEIHFMDTFGIRPSQYGPRVVNSPRLSFIRIVAKNRMQKAQSTDRDFSGAASQTQLFDNDAVILKSNIDCARSFLQELGAPETTKPINKHAASSKVWREVPLDNIKSFLKSYKFQKRQNVFKDIDAMLEWIKKMTDEGSIGKWNVVLSGLDKDKTKNGYWEVSPGIGIYKISRSQKVKKKEEGIINMGALRAPKDIIADIDLDKVSDPEVIKSVQNFNTKYPYELREKAGLSTTPQLTIHIVDKDSKPSGGSKNRCALEAKDDIVGLSIIIPGESKYSDNTATISVILDEMGLNNGETDVSDEN